MQCLVIVTWEKVGIAAKFLSSCGGEIGGSGRIGITRLQEELRAVGFPCSSAELCVLFRCLAIPCSENSTISVQEFVRLQEFESWTEKLDKKAIKHHDTLLGSLQLRRMLLELVKCCAGASRSPLL